jgi:hypothetical protein
MKNSRYMLGLMVLAGLAGSGSTAGANVYTPKGQVRNGIPPITSSEDAVSSIPLLAKIPHSFLIGEGFKFKLSGDELRIDHMADHSRAPVSRRNCLISFNFASPVAFFGSSMELPLVNAESLTSGWSASSLGDYVLHLSKDAPVPHPTIGLKVSARF